MKAIELVKQYATKFSLRWEDDLSEWEDDIGPSVGGAYDDGSTVHDAPIIYVTPKGLIICALPDETQVVDPTRVKEAIDTGMPLHET